MDFLRRVGDAVGDVLANSESEDEQEESFTEEREGVEANRNLSEDEDELDEIVSTAIQLGRRTFEKLKIVSKGVGKELKEGLKDIKEQVREDLAVFGQDVGETTEDERAEAENCATRANSRGIMYSEEGSVIPGGADLYEDGATVVEDQLEQVGEKIELIGQQMFYGAGRILSQVKETTRDAIKETKDAIRETREAFTTKENTRNSRRSRDEFLVRVQAIQRDSSTYCDVPSNSELFQRFCSTFSVSSRSEEISGALNSNGFMKELFSRVVPGIVSEETFWQRYFFKVYELEIEFGRQSEPLQTTGTEIRQAGGDGPEAQILLADVEPVNPSTHAEGSDSDSSLGNNWTNVDSFTSENQPTTAHSSIDETHSPAYSDEDEDWGMQ